VQLSVARWSAIENIVFMLSVSAFFCTCMVVTCG
jgi:hypothetical protein